MNIKEFNEKLCKNRDDIINEVTKNLTEIYHLKMQKSDKGERDQFLMFFNEERGEFSIKIYSKTSCDCYGKNYVFIVFKIGFIDYEYGCNAPYAINLKSTFIATLDSMKLNNPIFEMKPKDIINNLYDCGKLANLLIEKLNYFESLFKRVKQETQEQVKNVKETQNNLSKLYDDEIELKKLHRNQDNQLTQEIIKIIKG